jgi:serine protease Do
MIGWVACAAPSGPAFALDLVTVSQQVQPKMVKVYGAGGIRGLEAYQSGFLISAEGHILTAWSYVLDTEYITAILSDGRRFQAKLLGADPSVDIALIKVAAAELPFFDLAEAGTVRTGDRVLAFSNLYGIATGDEAASVLHGFVSAVTRLAARRGVYSTAYEGPVYVVDAMANNAGAAGGALTDRQGTLVGMLGKELRNAQNNTWLNYALPLTEIRPAIDDLLAGKSRRRDAEPIRKPLQPMTTSLLGLVLVPDVLPKTPPFIERVRVGSAARAAGLQPDDLIVFVQSNLVQSCQDVVDELSLVDRLSPVRLTVMREQNLLELELTIED